MNNKSINFEYDDPLIMKINNLVNLKSLEVWLKMASTTEIW